MSNLDTSLTWAILPLLACLALMALAWEVRMYVFVGGGYDVIELWAKRKTHIPN